jgi:hypothetical protein
MPVADASRGPSKLIQPQTSEPAVHDAVGVLAQIGGVVEDRRRAGMAPISPTSRCGSRARAPPAAFARRDARALRARA